MKKIASSFFVDRPHCAMKKCHDLECGNGSPPKNHQTCRKYTNTNNGMVCERCHAHAYEYQFVPPHSLARGVFTTMCMTDCECDHGILHFQMQCKGDRGTRRCNRCFPGFHLQSYRCVDIEDLTEHVDTMTMAPGIQGRHQTAKKILAGAVGSTELLAKAIDFVVQFARPLLVGVSSNDSKDQKDKSESERSEHQKKKSSSDDSQTITSVNPIRMR